MDDKKKEEVNKEIPRPSLTRDEVANLKLCCISVLKLPQTDEREMDYLLALKNKLQIIWNSMK